MLRKSMLCVETKAQEEAVTPDAETQVTYR
jgi:hypothetical protein